MGANMRVQNWAVHVAAPRAVAALILLAVMACTPVFSKHGYVPEEKDLARLEVGKDTRNTVAELIGRPSTAGLLNDLGWFYVQSRWKQQGPSAPTEVDRQVVAITFDDGGVVRNIEKFGLDQGRVIVLSRRVTASNVASAGFLKQLFGNVGGIGAGQILGK